MCGDGPLFHCRNIEVRMGSRDQYDIDRDAVWLKVKRVVPHEHSWYNDDFAKNDIALVEVEPLTNFTDKELVSAI